MLNEEVIPYIQSPKFLRTQFDANVIVYFDLMLDGHSYWSEHMNEFEEQTDHKYEGWFFYSRSEITERIRLKKGAQMNAEAVLKEAGLIKVKPDPYNANWYKVDLERLEEMYQEYLTSTKKKKSKISYPFANKQTTHDQEIDVRTSNDQPAAPPVTGGVELQQPVANKNKGLKMNNKNKVSNPTYVPDGTESIDSASDIDTSGSKNLNHSCIQDKSGTKAPPRSAPNGTGDEVQDIVNEYNAAMGLPQANGDYDAVFKNLDKFRKIRKYFTPKALELAWKNFGDDTASKLDTKRVSALVSYKVLDPFVQRRESLYTYIADYWDNSLDKLFRSQCKMINELTPDKYTVNRFGELEVNGLCAGTTKAHRRDRIEVYQNYIEPKLLPDEELHDMIIDMEVPEWII